HLSSQHTSSPSVLHSFPTRRSSDLDKLPKQNKYDDEKTDMSEWTQEKFNQVVRSHQDLAMKDKIYVFSIFRKSDYKNIGYVDISTIIREEFQWGAIGYRLQDRKSTRLNSSHVSISYAVFCLKK